MHHTQSSAARHMRAVTSRLLHSLEDILLRTVLFNKNFLSCLRSDIVILDTLIVLLTYLITYLLIYLLTPRVVEPRVLGFGELGRLAARVSLQGYKVYYSLNPDLPLSRWFVLSVDNSQLTTVSNLITNRTYVISVLAYTASGDGPMSWPPVMVKIQRGGEYSQ